MLLHTPHSYPSLKTRGKNQQLLQIQTILATLKRICFPSKLISIPGNEMGPGKI